MNEPPVARAADERLATLPSEFVDRLRRILPHTAWPDAVAAFTGPRPVGARVDSLRAEIASTVDELTAAGLTVDPLPWYAAGFTVPPEQRAALMATGPYMQGRVYLQNPSSMVPALALDPQPGEEVLDLAAAPGSKTLQLACLMGDRGRVAAVEKIKPRYYKLKANLAAHRVTSVRTYLADGASVWRKVPERFDRVLLDAPCSSEGRFRVDEPDSYSRWSLRKLNEMARKQRRLLSSAIQCLKPGGVMVYATCSFAPEENEAVVDEALRSFGERIAVEPLSLSVPTQPGLIQWNERAYAAALVGALRILPSAVMEGFFVCRLTKHESTVPASRGRRRR